MIKRIISLTIILTIIATAMFFYGNGQQPALVKAEAVSVGMAAYAQIGVIDLQIVKPVFKIIEYEETGLIVGTLDLPVYEAEYDPLVLVNSGGLILAFYPADDPAGKIVDVISKNLNETLLEKAVKIVAAKAGVTPDAVSHFDFAHPSVEKLLLVAEYEPDGNAFTLQMDSANTYGEKSYAFYRTFAPSFTLDNETIDQVNFALTNADYIGAGYYGTIFGRFGIDAIDFDPTALNTFAVQAGDHLGFGSLAILYSGTAPITVADKDFEKEIALVNPGVEVTIDLSPTDFEKKVFTFDDGGLVPTLSWEPSSAPNYEYCVDTTEDVICDTGWISVGSATSVTLKNLHYETTYFWQVRAFNSYGVVEADGGTWGSFTTAAGIAPGTFAKLTTTLTEPIDSLSKVTMTWTESYGAYYYEVCVDTTQSCIAPELWHNVGLNTTATIGDLQLDTTYYWQVRAINDFGVVEAGAWQMFTTRTFSKLRPYMDEVYNITLPFKWEATPIATNGYEYCISAVVNVCDQWKKVTGTSVVVKQLAAGTWFWQVRTFGSVPVYANGGVWWEFDVLSKKDVSKINAFKVSPINGAVEQPLTNLGLSWKATKTATEYQYCFFPVDDTDTTPISADDTCTYNDGNWVSMGTATSTTIATSLDSATTYYWQVRANIGTSVDPDWVYADKGDYWAFTTVP